MKKKFLLFICLLILFLVITPSFSDSDMYPSLVPGDTGLTNESSNIGNDSGWVSIESVPAGAETYFDGIRQGITPVKVKVVSTGSPYHQIWMQKDGYQEWSTSISENPLTGQTMTVRATLVSLPPTEHTTEIPTPFPTPTIIPMPTIIITESPTKSPTPTQIGGGTGWIKIDSVPSGGDVSFDGVYRGQAPVMISVYSTSPSYHQILVRMSGYYDWTHSLSANPNPGDTNSVIASLVPVAKTGSIRVTSTPSESIAIVD